MEKVHNTVQHAVRSIVPTSSDADNGVLATNANLALAALAGAAVGILIGLLVAPCTGRELRQGLWKKLRELRIPDLDDQKMIDLELERMTGEGGIG
jgi:hypothetical protein